MYCTVPCTVQRVPARQPASLGRVRVGLVWAAGPPLLQRIRGLASHNSHTYLASAAVIPAYLLSSSHTYISIIWQSYLNIYYYTKPFKISAEMAKKNELEVGNPHLKMEQI